MEISVKTNAKKMRLSVERMATPTSTRCVSHRLPVKTQSHKVYEGLGELASGY
ncbi:MAG: hypothetical protein EoVTN8_234 [Fluviibacter phosphoraccumulans EoVTN8]